VATGTLTPAAAKALATAAFPLLSQEIVNRIFDNIKEGEITPEQIREAGR
jgi:hypothetical protein